MITNIGDQNISIELNTKNAILVMNKYQLLAYRNINLDGMYRLIEDIELLAVYDRIIVIISKDGSLTTYPYDLELELVIKRKENTL